MFNLIETVIAKDQKYEQLFISTHNLDFLKYIKRLTVPKGDNQVNYFVVEKRKMNTEYRCFLIKMPPFLRDYVTEYNFLFAETVAKQIIKAIMKDKEHFEALCDSMGVDKTL